MVAILADGNFKCILWNEIIEFRSEFDWYVSQESNWQWVRIGSDNGSAPNKRQTITWTNADPVHWRIYAARRRDELKKKNCFFGNWKIQ